MFFTSAEIALQNRSFLFGDSVKVYFFVRNSELIMAEECYFFLMACMRKMRMNIPLSYTLEFFQQLFLENVIQKGFSNGIINFMAFRNLENGNFSKSTTEFYFDVTSKEDILELGKPFTMDMIKEITVNTGLLDNIRVHCPENIYAEIYAAENDLDDLILLNPSKRIARSIYGNLLFLQENVIKIPKQTEGSFISPLMENFITFVHRQNFAEIEQVEMAAFESQKADEILMISDEKGIFPVQKIRNRKFGISKFTEMLHQWRNSFQ